MKINKQTMFVIVLVCFALIDKSMSTKKTESPSSSPSKKDSDTPNKKDSDTPNKKESDTPNKKEKYISSDSPAQAPDSDASGRSSSVSFTKYLKEKYGDQSKTKYNPILQKICGKTHDSDVCLATISPLLKSKKEFDAARVLEASLKVSKESIKDVVEKIGKQAKESPKNAGPLKDCKKHYNQALDDLHETLEAIRAKNYGKVNVLLSGVVADVSTAESKIVDLQLPKFKVEPFTFATVTASNSLSIASLVGK